jgi:hypothetical protein
LLKIDKVVPFKETEAIKHGNEVHKALELRLKDKVPLPEKYMQYESIAAKLDKPGVLCTSLPCLIASVSLNGTTLSILSSLYWRGHVSKLVRELWLHGGILVSNVKPS